jgi:Peptidase family M28
VDPQTTIRELAGQVREDELGRHLANLSAPRSRDTAPEAAGASLAYLREVFACCGWQVVDQPCQDPVLGSGLNLVATLPGVTQPEALVVVGAQHDTVPSSPGADDNGSGLARLLELNTAPASTTKAMPSSAAASTRSSVSGRWCVWSVSGPGFMSVRRLCAGQPGSEDPASQMVPAVDYR